MKCPKCGHVMIHERLATGAFDTREELEEEVMRLYNEGVRGTEISWTVKVSAPTVSKIIKQRLKEDG